MDKEKSVKVGDHYAIAVDDAVTDKREYRVYHVMDIGKLDNALAVNLRHRDMSGRLAESAVPFEKFLNMVRRKVLIPMD